MLDRPPINSADAGAYHDLAGLRKLRNDAREQSPEAIRAVAQQMEGLFLNLMLKSMRQASSSFGEDNPFSSQEVRTYEEMRDQQLSLTMANAGGIGLARVIERQLTQQASQRWTEDRQDTPDASGSNQPGLPGDITGYRRIPALNTTLPVGQSLERARLSVVAPPVSVSERDLDNNKPVASIPVQDLNNQRQFNVAGPIDFVNQILPHAQRAGEAMGVDPMAIVAQAALETGWGKHVMQDKDGNSSFNLFGIKADQRWQGQSVSVWTEEYRNGIAGREIASFRAYDSLDAAFADYVNFLSNQPRYQSALQAGNDPHRWGSELQQAGYATDPSYGKKIAGIVSRLTKSDAF